MLFAFKLVFIHLLFDFVFQPDSWVKDRLDKKIRSSKMLLHAFLHGFFSWVILWNPDYWWVGLVIFVLHYLIDIWKSYQKDTLRYFLIDQGLHFLTLVLLVFLIKTSGHGDWPGIELRQPPAFYFTLLIAFLILMKPTSILIKFFMTRFDLEEPDTYSLENAGKWIGYLERTIILISVFAGAWSVLGFLVAAKSLLRFGERENMTRSHTEYVLIGSLLSWAIGIATGVAAIQLTVIPLS